MKFIGLLFSCLVVKMDSRLERASTTKNCNDNADQELWDINQNGNQTTNTNKDISEKKQLFIGNLRSETTEEDVYKLFGLIEPYKLGWNLDINGVESIIISSALVKNDNKLIRRVNISLKHLCKVYGFNFICNDRIGKVHYGEMASI